MSTNETTGTEALRAKARSGASWFYWIAGLSLVNSIVAASGSTWGFMAGLGVTQLIDGLTQAAGAPKPVALGLDVMVATVFVGLGIWAGRRRAGYLIGIIAYALDGTLFLLVRDWVGLGFHGLVLFFLINGFAARRALDAAGDAPVLEEPVQKAA